MAFTLGIRIPAVQEQSACSDGEMVCGKLSQGARSVAGTDPLEAAQALGTGEHLRVLTGPHTLGSSAEGRDFALQGDTSSKCHSNTCTGN